MMIEVEEEDETQKYSTTDMQRQWKILGILCVLLKEMVSDVTFSRRCNGEHYKAFAICEMVAASAGEELRRRGNRTNT